MKIDDCSVTGRSRPGPALKIDAFLIVLAYLQALGSMWGCSGPIVNAGGPFFWLLLVLAGHKLFMPEIIDFWA